MRSEKFGTYLVNNLFVVLALLFCSFAHATPNLMTFQSRIVKPDGKPLEASAVNFRFTLTDALGTCVIYQEDFANRNMSSSKGLINITLGGGTKIYPAGPMDLGEVFNNYNFPTFNCQSGGTVNAGATDRRRLVMQFNDGSGWQTLPAMDINANPYAMQATKAYNLGDYPATDYLRTATIPTCNPAEALNFNGAAFTCIAAGGAGAGTVTSVTSANVDIGVATTTSTPVLTLNSTVAGAADKIVKLNGTGQFGAINATNLTNLNASALASGTVPAAQMPALTGDVTMAAGSTSTSIAAGVIVDADINASAAIARSKIAASTVGERGDVLINDGSGNISSLQCANGEVIKFDGAGAAVCGTDNSGTGDVINGGNTVAGTMTVGTNSNHALEFETNGTSKMAILADGSVGIGTTNPIGIFVVQPGAAAAASNGLGITLTGQTAGAGNQNGGSINLTSGTATGNGSGGTTTLSGGAGLSGVGGAVNINGGPSLSSTPGTVNITGGHSASALTAGTVNIFGGNNLSTGVGGTVNVSGGTGGATSGAGGVLNLSGGAPWGGGAGGSVNISGANALTGNNNGGNVVIRAGAATGSGTAGTIQFTSGNVGIGTSTPARLLHVEGPMRITPSAAPGTPAAGDIYVDSGDSNKLKVYDGSGWVAAGGAGGGGTVTSVNSANADIAVANTTTTPSITLNSSVIGAADKIVKLDGAGKFGAIDASALTNVNASALASGTVPAGRMPAFTGDVTTAGGAVATTIAANAVTSAKILDDEIINADIKSNAAIARSKLASGTNNHVLINDGSGVMSSEAQLAVSRGGTGLGSYTNNALIMANGTGTALTNATCNVGEVLMWNATAWACTSMASSGQGYFKDGGNTFTGTATIGTNSNHALEFETNGTSKMAILANGNVGVGTTNPGSKLEVSGNLKVTNGGVEVPGTTPYALLSDNLTDANSILNGGMPNTDRIVIGKTGTKGTFLGSYSYDYSAYRGVFTKKDTSNEEVFFGTSYDMDAYGSQNESGVAVEDNVVRVRFWGEEILRIFGQGMVKPYYGNSANGANDFLFYRGRGSASAMTSVQAADSLGRFDYYGVNGSNALALGARIDAEVESVDASTVGTKLVFGTAPTGGALASRMTIAGNGNVGIGTTSPARLLHVAGPMRITPSVAPGAPAAGDIYVDSGDSNKLKVYDGSGWVAAGGAGGGGTVTSVNSANADIAVANTTTTPSMTLNSSVVGAADKIVKLDASGNFGAINASALTNLNASALASGTVPAGRMPAFTGDVTTAGGAVATTIAANAVTSAKILDDEIVNADIKSNAAIARSKLASGTNNHVLINDGSGVMSSEAQLAVSRGGTGLGSYTNNALIMANGTGTALTNATCNVGEILMWNATTWACTSMAASGQGYFKDGGNTFTGTATIGTNSNHALEFETNGTSKMAILADGKVGLGTTAPVTPLNVVSSSSSTVGQFEFPCAGCGAWINVYNTDTTVNVNNRSGINFSSINSANVYGQVTGVQTGASSANGALYFATTAAGALTEKMRIDSDGNVGIGTTTPGAVLNVVGPNGISNGSAAPTVLQISGGNGVTNASGFVGGSGSPILVVSGNGGQDTIGGAGGGISFVAGNGGTGNTVIGGAGGVINLTAGNAGSSTSSIAGGSINLNPGTGSGGGGYGNVVLASSGGNVGVGTATPGSKVEIAGDLALSEGANRTIKVPTSSTGAGNNLTILAGHGDNSAGGHLYLLGGNNVYPGFGPNGMGQGGNVEINSGDGDDGPGYVILANNTGNVGVGTTTPTQKLDVNGTVSSEASIEGATTYVNSTAAYSIPDTSVNIRRITANANTTITLPAFTSTAVRVYTLTVFIKQDGTGSRTVAWAGNGGNTIKWDSNAAPTISPTAGKITILQFTKVSDESVWYGSMVWKED